MYSMGFTHPDYSTTQLITSNASYIRLYIDGLMLIHDLICDMGQNRQPREFAYEEIHKNMAEILRPDVYISFRVSDGMDEAIRLAKYIRSHNISTWIYLPQTSIKGENWDIYLKHSSLLLSIITPEVTQSTSIKREWSAAKQFQKPILFVLTRNTYQDLISHQLRQEDVIISFSENMDEIIRKIHSISHNNLNEDTQEQLPFNIVENLTQNYDAARRIWHLASTYSQRIEAESLDMESIASRFVSNLIRTYTALRRSNNRHEMFYS